MKKIIFLIFVLFSSMSFAQFPTNSFEASCGYGGIFESYCNQYCDPDQVSARNNKINSYSCSANTPHLPFKTSYGNDAYCVSSCSCPQGYQLSSGWSGNLGDAGSRQKAICVPVETSSSSSSSSSSSIPSCDVGFHWDFTVNGQPVEGSTCIPDVASSSSSNASSASSLPASSAATSSASGSSGSVSSNRDQSPTSSSELCELNFGVGNCTAVAQSSPCANSYTVNGQKFCVTDNSSNSSAGSSSGGSSGGGTSAPSVTASANNCTSQPTCTGGDPIQCAILRQSWLNFCDGAENKTDINADSDSQAIGAEFDRLVNENQTALNSDGTIAGVQGQIDVSQYADMVGNLNNAASQASSGNCPSPRTLQMSFGSFELSYQPMCDLAEGISFYCMNLSRLVHTVIFFIKSHSTDNSRLSNEIVIDITLTFFPLKTLC